MLVHLRRVAQFSILSCRVQRHPADEGGRGRAVVPIGQARCCSSTAAPEATRQALLTLPVASPEERLLHAQVFCYKGSAAHEEMRRACFDYLRLGGWYSAGPVSLLSGLNPRPSVLVMHFFAVAVFGVGRLLMPRPTLRCPPPIVPVACRREH